MNKRRALLLACAALTLHGWFFEIDSARLHVLDPNATTFIPIEQLAQSAERRLAQAG